MILGIVGGAIALILAIALFVGGSFVASFPWMNYSNGNWNYNNSSDFDWSSDSFDSSDWNWNDDYSSDKWNNLADSLDNYDSGYAETLVPEIMEDMPGVVQSAVSAVFIFPAICAAIAGVLGLVGGIIVKKRNVAAGVLMIISAVLSLFSFFNVISMALFIVGAVFALMRDRSKQQGYVPPYPMPSYAYPQPPQYPQPPYPQQPYTPPVYPTQPQQPQQPVPPSENPPENSQP